MMKGDSVRKGIYIIPNLFTSASLFGGFYAIVAALDGNFYYAAVAIMISCLLDGMDGKIARITNTSSRFGVEYDSLADLVAFGVAPAVLIFTWALRPFGRFGWLAAFVYLVCGALRLARYNIQIETIESRSFNGLPTPAAASLIATTVLLFTYYGYAGNTTKHITILLFTYLLAYLMVSNVKYHSFKEIDLSKRRPFMLLVGIILLLIVVVLEPHMMLFLLTFGYILSGPYMALFKKGGRKDDFMKVA
jgi:CDP-diacylglycerol--serine O-phosphatidyltransferase